MPLEQIPLGSDHAGFELKQELIEFLTQEGFTPIDQGCFSTESVPYPEYGKKVAQLLAQRQAERGILICGSGIGMSITANRFKGVRGTLVHDEETARLCRLHNNSNLLILGARALSPKIAKKLVKIWLTTPFEGGRHQQRLNLIDQK